MVKLTITRADNVSYQYDLTPVADELISDFLAGRLVRITFVEKPPEHMRGYPYRFELRRD